MTELATSESNRPTPTPGGATSAGPVTRATHWADDAAAHRRRRPRQLTARRSRGWVRLVSRLLASSLDHKLAEGQLTGVEPAPGRPSSSPRRTSLTSRATDSWENLLVQARRPPAMRNPRLLSTATHHGVQVQIRQMLEGLLLRFRPPHAAGDGEPASPRRRGTDLQPPSLGGFGYRHTGSDCTAGPIKFAVSSRGGRTGTGEHWDFRFVPGGLGYSRVVRTHHGSREARRTWKREEIIHQMK